MIHTNQTIKAINLMCKAHKDEDLARVEKYRRAKEYLLEQIKE